VADQKHLEEFMEFLSIPSVSALPDHKDDMRRAAAWLADRMKRAGIDGVEIIETKGHPVVFGRKEAPVANAPTVLIYGHYDTQPADPLNEWVSEPFKPEIRDGKIYARGSSDDKGGVFPAILAAEEVIGRGELTVNLEFLFEGEEEIGSPNLKELLIARKEDFKSDLVVSVDGGMYSVDTPSLTVGCRGLAAVQIEVTGPRTDIHSGQGGNIANPIQALAQILAGMKGPDGTILIEGFYEDVAEPSPMEKEAMATVPFDEEAVKDQAGVPALFGEPGYSPVERIWVRPTLDPNGIWGGFQGEGIKTIIPSKASCKITCRLVPHQEPDKICKLIEEHVKRNVPTGVTVTVKSFPGSSRPYVVPGDHPVLPVMTKVLRELYGKDPVVNRLGGTLPIARAFLDILGTYLVFFAMSSPDSGAHGPNEFFRVEEFDRLRTGLPKLWAELGKALK